MLQPTSLTALADLRHAFFTRDGGVSGGVYHSLNGGPGTDTFDMLSAMRRWVENGDAPKDLPASRVEHGNVVRTRPLCPYPQVATYRGSGSTDEAKNFVCK